VNTSLAMRLDRAAVACCRSGPWRTSRHGFL